MSKYHSRKVAIDGITFDSKKEAHRFQQLRLLERADKITDLQRQVRFELIPAQYESFPRYGKRGQRLKDGRKCVEQSCSYVADFVYQQDGQTVVEDTKGMRTTDYVIKRKMMLYFHGIRIKEV